SFFRRGFFAVPLPAFLVVAMSAILLCQCLICKHVKIVLAEKPEWVYIESNVMLAEKERERNEPMPEPTTALSTTQPSKLEKSSPFSFAPTNFSEALQFADRLAKSELVPKAFQGKPQDVLVAMQLGAEVGL